MDAQVDENINGDSQRASRQAMKKHGRWIVPARWGLIV